jgi:hypothetical protein
MFSHAAQWTDRTGAADFLSTGCVMRRQTARGVARIPMHLSGAPSIRK